VIQHDLALLNLYFRLLAKTDLFTKKLGDWVLIFRNYVEVQKKAMDYS